MARIIAMSSQVVRGHVGLSAIVPALEGLGHEVTAFPTILLSSHPGHRSVEGVVIPPATLHAMVDAVDANGWLAEADALITGYLPSPEHVEVAATLAMRLAAVRGPDQWLYLCDPVIGDEPKGLYVPQPVAIAIRDRLLPLASHTTPNAFELGWLAGRSVASPADARTAAGVLPTGSVIATSVPGADVQRLANVLVRRPARPEGDLCCSVAKRRGVPHGTGDLIAALLVGRLVTGADDGTALAMAVAGVEAAISASAGADELQLAASRDAWASPPPEAIPLVAVLAPASEAP